MTTDPRPHTGRLIRETDVSGVSGTGHVADLVLWSDGTAAVRGLGEHPSTVHWDRGQASIDHVHSHGGATRIVWDLPLLTPRDLDAVQQHVQTALQSEIECWDTRLQLDALWAVVRDVQPLLSEVADLRSKLDVLTSERSSARGVINDLGDLLADVEDGAAEQQRAGEAQAAALDAAREALDAATTAMAAHHHEHTAAVANWRARIAEAADILDIAGHHESAALMRRHASIPAKTRRSVYAANSLPIPLEDRHRDALAAIAMSAPAEDQPQAAALVALARAALGLDTAGSAP